MATREKILQAQSCGKKDSESRLDFCLVPRNLPRHMTCYIHNDTILCGSWDHFFLFTITRGAGGPVQNTQNTEFAAGSRSVNEEGKAGFKVEVMRKEGTEQGNGVEDIQKQMEVAAKSIISVRATRKSAQNADLGWRDGIKTVLP